MPHAQVPEEAFRSSLPSKDTFGTAIPHGPSKYAVPCRHGPSCRLLELGECYYYHEAGLRPVRLELMADGLSAPMILSDFGPVDTTFQWYGIRDVDALASFNVLKGGRLAVPGMSLVSCLSAHKWAANLQTQVSRQCSVARNQTYPFPGPTSPSPALRHQNSPNSTPCAEL